MNKEGLKEKITWYRHLFTFLAAINFTCIGWFIANYSNNALKFILYSDAAAIILSYAGMAILGLKIKKHIKTLGEK